MCPSRRTDKTVVDRIRRFVFMSAILYYNSGEREARSRLRISVFSQHW
jgi:hypothetical protein